MFFNPFALWLAITLLAAGRVTASIDDFNAANRLTGVVEPNGLSRTTYYDGLGRKTQDIDEAGVITAYTYDFRGLLTSATLAAGTAQAVTTLYSYDEAGNEVSQTDAAGRVTTFQYDALGRRIGRRLPAGQSEGFGYDLSGNQLNHTNFNGVVITNAYDVMNRLLVTRQAVVSGYQASFAYNATTGLRTSMVDVSGTTGYQYDERNELTNKTVALASGPTLALNYAYSTNGSLTGLWSSSAGGMTNGYQYDLQGRLTNVLARGGAIANYSYDVVGNLQSVGYVNGVTNLCQYDALNRLTNQMWKAGGTALANFTYSLGPTGNRTALAESVNGVNRTNNWAYDYLYRLTGEGIGTAASKGTVSYGYDLVGNRTNRSSAISQIPSATASYTANDWLGSDTYDSDGNTTASATVPYQYDVLDHLTNVNNGAVVLGYDGDGNRVRKTVGSITTYYLVDEQNPSAYAQVVEEWTTSGTSTNLSRVYNYGLDLVNQVQVTGAAGTNYFVFDGHGSTRLLVNLNGTVANVFAYDAYGILIASNTTAQTAYLYCGQQYDSDLGMYYQRARYMNQNTGRFWTMDTHEGDNDDPLSLHKYLYCSANPINMTDPSGHDGDLGSLMISSSIGTSFDAMYNGGVTVAFDSMKATITGVEKNMSAQQIMTGYLLDTAIGIGVGVAIGAAAQFSEELIYGSSAARSACFVAGTPVAAESGEKPIEKIKRDDLVWSWNERTGDFQLGKVLSTHVRRVNEEVIIHTADETITATPAHPFRVGNKGWVLAGELKPGDQFISLGGDTETVTETTTTNASVLVYNFEVENTHTYFVGEQPVLVHNACAWATRKVSLPDEPGIYVIRTSTGDRYVGQAKNLSTRLSDNNHEYSNLIRDPNNEVYTMSLDVSKVKGSVDDALHAAEDFYIKALAAKRTTSNPRGLNARFQRNPNWMNQYFQQNGFPPIGNAVAH